MKKGVISMKRYLAFTAILCLLLTGFAFSSVCAEEECFYVIQDFEASSVISAGDQQTAVLWNTINPLNGQGSAQITWPAGKRSEESFDFDGGFRITGYEGIAMRLRTNAEYDAWIRLWLPDLDSEAHGTQFWAMLGSNAQFIDTEGKDVTPEYYASEAYQNLTAAYNGFSVPAGFDGYVVIPFTGKTNAGLDYSLDLNAHIIRLMMLTVGSEFTPCDDYWDDKSLELDSIVLYKGISPLVLPAKLNSEKTGLVTYVHTFNQGREYKNNQVDTLGANLVHEVSAPLLGSGSLVIELSKENAEPSFGTDPIDVSGQVGFVFRLKTDCEDHSWMRFYLQLPGTGNFFLGEGVKLFDINGQDVTPAEHTSQTYNGKSWMGFSLPAGFDGYVFAPMTGISFESAYKSYTLDKAYIPFISFLSYENMGDLTSWVGKNIVVDSVAMYNTEDYADVIAELEQDIPAPNTVQKEEDPEPASPPPVDESLEDGAVKLIFDLDSEIPFSNNEPALEISLETASPLLGEGTLKGRFGAGVGTESGLSSIPFEATAGYRGIVFRFRSNVGDRAMLRTWLSNANDMYSLGKGVKLITVYGEDVTPEEISDAPGYAAYFTVADFDGYVFLPFPGSDWWDKTGLDTSLDAALHFKFVNRYSAWDGTKFFIDQIAYYKGESLEDYMKAIENLGGTILTKQSASMQDPLTDYEHGITIEDMFGGAIPGGASLSVVSFEADEKIVDALAAVSSNAQIRGCYDINLIDEMFYETVNTNGRAMQLVFEIPEDADPSQYHVLELSPEGTINEIETEYDEGEAYIYVAVMKLGRFLVVEQ